MVRSIDDSGAQVKVWLDYPTDIDALASEARDRGWQRRIAILLMGKSGLRASGVPSAKPAGLSYNDEGDFWQLEVKGKNTKGGEKTTRQTYVPTSIKRELENYAKERDIAPSEAYVDVSTDSIRRWVREAASNLTDSDERWQHVSSHDLRRAWANHCLVEQEVSVRVMMAVGGWSSYDAIEPYLTHPSSEKIGEELNPIA